MNTILRRPRLRMTTAEFLDWPGDGRAKHYQLVDGEVCPVPPAIPVHSLIQGNIFFLIKSAIRSAGLPLRAAPEAAIVPSLNAAKNVRVPDVAVTAAANTKGQKTLPGPILIVEVLSESNERETRDNVRAYSTLPSVQEMLVLHSDQVLAEVHRRDGHGHWLPDPETVFAGGRLVLASVHLNAAITEAYEDTWLAN
jgi:Uma2 family endonuclease